MDLPRRATIQAVFDLRDAGALRSILQHRIGGALADLRRRDKPAIATIVAHNHPLGDPTPSPEDMSVTKAIAGAGKLLDIDILDHIVIGRGSHISLKSRGLGF